MRKGLVAILKTGLLLTPASWIEAEILFCGKAAKKIAADSPVFLPARGQKNAPKFRPKG
jgi:hypothetical protein